MEWNGMSLVWDRSESMERSILDSCSELRLDFQLNFMENFFSNYARFFLGQITFGLMSEPCSLQKKTWSFLACSTWSGSLWLFHMWCMRYLSEFFWAHVHYVLWFKILSDPNFDKIWHFKIRQPTIPSSDHSNGRNWHFLLLLLSQMHAIFIEMVSQLQTNRNELNSNKTVLSITNLLTTARLKTWANKAQACWISTIKIKSRFKLTLHL